MAEGRFARWGMDLGEARDGPGQAVLGVELELLAEAVSTEAVLGVELELLAEAVSTEAVLELLR
jgi:hypothetical protein